MKAMLMQLNLEGEVSGRPDKARDEFIATRLAKSPTGEGRLMETICGRENMLEALKRVEGNKGAPGVDGMKTTQLRGYLTEHWDKIKSALLEGTHRPMPVRRKEIPKESGGIRLLGIPTVLDRLIQQAVAQQVPAQPHGAWHCLEMGGSSRQHPQGRMAAQQERNRLRGAA